MNKEHTQNVFVLDDGTREFTIQDTFGQKICTLTFRPGDMDIIPRIQKFAEDFSNIGQTALARLDDANDVSMNAQIDALHAVEAEMIDKLAALVGSDSVRELFRGRSAFAILNDGKLYFERVLDMIAKIIDEELGEQASLLATRNATGGEA